MSKILINGGNSLKGEVNISGAKNAAVAILPAIILAQDVCVVENIPSISDVEMMIRILHQLGAKIKKVDDTTYEIDSSTIDSYVVSYEMTKRLRASYYLYGALLGRFGRANVAIPGGCPFCVRPIDQHVKAFETLGAQVNLSEQSMLEITANELIGSTIFFDVVSVGATINAMLAAVKAKGVTIIENAAKEPHIVDLANFLNTMGADVRGAGTDTIKIYGVEYLHGCTYSIIPDQIEAGTFMVAAAATKGEVLIKNVIPKHLESITKKLVECGVDIVEFDDSVFVRAKGRLKNCKIKTSPHPGFPTDMQPQFVTMLAMCEGTSHMHENVWEYRFQYIEHLNRMGANITTNGSIAVIEGVEELKGAIVAADDLRAGAAMIIAGLLAEGTTTIENVDHIDRGYVDVVGKFRSLGADIWRVEEDTPTVLKAEAV